jgi:hypothetical protein
MECQHKKRDGKRCKAPALTGQTSCAMHAHPGRAAELGRRGGSRRAVYNPDDLRDFAAPRTAADLRDLLAESIIEIRAGKLDPKVANALGYLGTSYLRALELSDIENRLNVLESNQRLEERACLRSSVSDGKSEGEM